MTMFGLGRLGGFVGLPHDAVLHVCCNNNTLISIKGIQIKTNQHFNRLTCAKAFFLGLNKTPPQKPGGGH